MRSDGRAELWVGLYLGRYRLVNQVLPRLIHPSVRDMRRDSTVRELICDPSNLHAAWADVLAHLAAKGSVGKRAQEFSVDLKRQFDCLVSQLDDGSFVAGRLTPVRMAKPDGGHRDVRLSTLRDRVLERAVARVLAEEVDGLLTPWSFGYRPGMGVTDAIAAAASMCEPGSWVITGDFVSCFDRLRHLDVLRGMDRLVGDPWVRSVVAALLQRPVRGSAEACSGVGLPQGSALSPVLCNVALDRLDMKLCEAGVPTVRYADDLLTFAPSQTAAEDALGSISTVAAQFNMTLGSKKTAIAAVDDRFTFLGEDLGDEIADRDSRSRTPFRRTLYAGLDGVSLTMKSSQLRVMRDSQELLRVPVERVGRIVVQGAVGLSAGVRSATLANGVPSIFLSRRGSMLGVLLPARSTSSDLRRQQVRRSDDGEFTLDLARRLVTAKLQNQRALLLRLLRRDSAPALQGAAGALFGSLRQLANASTNNEVMGVEGVAAARYFSALSAAVPQAVRFDRRSRRPPLDVAKPPLSYGYAILLGECVTALHAAGLDPSFGFLHADHESRPSLALDLMEEFRPCIVDTAVIEMLRRGVLKRDHGRSEDGRPGVLLTTDGCRRVQRGLEERLLIAISYGPAAKRLAWRQVIAEQAQRIAAVVRSGDANRYSGVNWR